MISSVFTYFVPGGTTLRRESYFPSGSLFCFPVVFVPLLFYVWSCPPGLRMAERWRAFSWLQCFGFALRQCVVALRGALVGEANKNPFPGRLARERDKCFKYRLRCAVYALIFRAALSLSRCCRHRRLRP